MDLISFIIIVILHYLKLV